MRALLPIIVMLGACSTPPEREIALTIPAGEYRWSEPSGIYVWCPDAAVPLSGCRLPDPELAAVLRADTCADDTTKTHAVVERFQARLPRER